MGEGVGWRVIWVLVPPGLGVPSTQRGRGHFVQDMWVPMGCSPGRCGVCELPEEGG